MSTPPPSFLSTISNNPEYFANAFGLGRIRDAINTILSAVAPERRQEIRTTIINTIKTTPNPAVNPSTLINHSIVPPLTRSNTNIVRSFEPEVSHSGGPPTQGSSSIMGSKGGRRTKHHKSKRGHKKQHTTRRR